MPIPYPKREFLTDDDNEDKADTGASKVSLAVVGSTKKVITTLNITTLNMISVLYRPLYMWLIANVTCVQTCYKLRRSHVLLH